MAGINTSARRAMQVFGIVGWKNNGKTTLVERLIANLVSRGYKVSSVKHAHHNVDLEVPGTDSHRHRAAGTFETMLATSHRWALMHEYRGAEETRLDELLSHFSACDIVIVEGYKQGQHPKIEVVRQPNERGLLVDLVPNITAIATDLDDLQADTRQLDINDIDAVADFVLQQTGFLNKTDAQHRVNDCYSDSQHLAPAQQVWDAMQSAATQTTGIEALSLDECHNRRLAEDVCSQFDSPRFDNVAVDGWAIRYDDLDAAHFRLPIMTGEANAGGSGAVNLQPGHCLRVFTGARMPTGADTIVMQEDAQVETDNVIFPVATKNGSNWRPQGEDVQQGQVILSKGGLVRPQDIGLAAATGHTHLNVHKPVKVALFSTGDEVHEIGTPLPEDGIYDVNRHLLKALYRDLHCEVTDLGILEDDYQAIHAALSQASQDHDLIVTSGGASTGNHDHIAKVLEQLGQVDAWRVAIKPGRPLAFGRIGKALFLGLPGNPVAANVCSLMFGAPLVRQLAGGAWQQPQAYSQTLGFDIKKKIGRREWIRVYRETQSDGRVLLKRSASHGSGILTSMTRADGLVEVDESSSLIPSGSQVDYIPFGSFGINHR